MGARSQSVTRSLDTQLHTAGSGNTKPLIARPTSTLLVCQKAGVLTASLNFRQS